MGWCAIYIATDWLVSGYVTRMSMLSSQIRKLQTRNAANGEVRPSDIYFWSGP